ncbi:MAG: FAD-dependent oxidoreductase [Candidatus Omnitrophota bacterium]
MRILIVGGVAGGASAAARARRLSEDAQIVIFERGEHISFANCGLPYYIGGVIQDRQRLLVQTPPSMRSRYHIDVRISTEVLKIDRQDKFILIKDLKTGLEQKEYYDALILSPGAAPLRPPLPGIDSAKVRVLRNISDMDSIKTALDTGRVKKAVVVGGGYIGLEMAEALRECKVDVTVVELKDQVMEPVDPEMAAFLHQEITLRNVHLCLGTAVKSFKEENDALRLELSTGDFMTCDLAILAIGVRPEAHLAKEAGIEIGDRGGIVVDENMRTSDPFVFAVGDAVEVSDFVTGVKTGIPLAGPASRQGRMAADAIFLKQSVYKGTQGTAICKVFGLTVGMTGVNEKQLKNRGIFYEKIYIHPADHANYYPGASLISIKLLFNPDDGKILGAQAVGRQGVDKRIDILAVAMRAGLTVRDLQDLELTYAPPYGSAKDPINYLGFVASDLMDGLCRICHVDDVLKASPDQVLLDVRDLQEVELGTIPGSKHIPVNDLRQRLQELPKDKEFLVFCRVGLRGYLACRILLQNGYKCRNLSGGYLIYEAKTGLWVKPMAADKELMKRADVKNTDFLKHTAPHLLTRIDACGLQCPGPILRIKQAVDLMAPGDRVEIAATDPGFSGDIKAWCQSTGHELQDLRGDKSCTVAVICKKEKIQSMMPEAGGIPSKTIVVFSSDFDKVVASFVIATGAVAMGSQVTMFFTFWGLNVLRRPESIVVKKNMVEHMFGWMMPRGADKLSLSKMHMAGAGTWMIKEIMKRKNISSLPEFIEIARKSGIRLVACTMSMDLMGIKKEELIDGVEFGGVAMYLERADQGNVNLFV